MIVHRARRDIQRCRQRYGDAWKEYEKRVPWLFIPVSFYPLLLLFKWLCETNDVVCFLRGGLGSGIIRRTS